MKYGIQFTTYALTLTIYIYKRLYLRSLTKFNNSDKIMPLSFRLLKKFVVRSFMKYGIHKPMCYYIEFVLHIFSIKTSNTALTCNLMGLKCILKDIVYHIAHISYVQIENIV